MTSFEDSPWTRLNDLVRRCEARGEFLSEVYMSCDDFQQLCEELVGEQMRREVHSTTLNGHVIVVGLLIHCACEL